MHNGAEPFAGKVVLITGGTKGVGAGIAKSFLAAGATVLVCARNEPDTLPQAEGRGANFIAANLKEAGAATALLSEVLARHGRLDVLVNNAGGAPYALAANVSPRFMNRSSSSTCWRRCTWRRMPTG